MKLTLALIFCFFYTVSGHGRLISPPSRASMWRFGFENPIDYNDNEGFCGGYAHQQFEMGGKCGICGDAYDAPIRDHEAPNGKYANGIIAAEYNSNDIIDVAVEITSNHMGYLIFKMCANNDIMSDPTQDCFDQTPLTVYPSGEEKFQLPKPYNVGIYNLKLKLPQDVTCEQCILQWTYITGNSWGVDKNGIGCVGCGPQENFRACSDIKINKNSNTDDSNGNVSTTSSTSTSSTTSTTTQKSETPNISTTVSSTTNGKIDGVLCQVLSPYNEVEGMLKWCTDNCRLGNCQNEICNCS